ncbi:adenosylcobinamide-GDP ribazoletransferase [Paractinoplanes ferrugineus]|uniref:Adenosylcobinamide-GDP ribazoletransferase n=1 Tax=Paractinoplanes ferrugineus TaxID=113564 RepID=A0A919MC92_9ACTN|nr:adenosylcobinamide-GDP ribazoletransferase [Actinoplanes ferrugineus]GIE14461.1 adenosylcobinamide-GDP ribazoletransferase [Actinoplanes ferrugineus]
MSALAGLRLAVTTLTVLPVRGGRVDRPAAAWAMSLAAGVGAALGAVLGGLLWVLREAGAPPLLAGALTVVAAALLTRGMHLDGLADTVDALGSYKAGGAALDIMKKSDIGPFGVAAIALVLLVQAASVGAVSPWALIAAFAGGRLAITVACHRRVPAARPDGLGALVAGTVPTGVVLTATGVVAAGAAAVPGPPWQGPAAVLAALVIVVLLLRHAVRRFGGITGDVLGAAVELATSTALVVLSLS